MKAKCVALSQSIKKDAEFYVEIYQLQWSQRVKKIWL